MGEKWLRGVVVCYIAILWLSVWPVPDFPLLGRLQISADKLLLSVGIRPGMAVFAGPESGTAAPHISCTTVLGRSHREWQTLYASRCPPRGMLIFQDPLELTINRMMGAPKLPAAADPFPRSEGAPEAVRHLVELLDYFCYSGSDPDLDRVVLRWVQQRRDFRDGSFLPVGHHLVCTQDCAPSERPSCRYRPYESEPE